VEVDKHAQVQELVEKLGLKGVCILIDTESNDIGTSVINMDSLEAIGMIEICKQGLIQQDIQGE